MTAAAVASSVVVTEPGIYDIDVDDYHRDPVPGGSLSSSGARKLLPPSCPAKFRYEQDNPGPSQARHFDLGHAAHKLVLGVGAPLVVIDAANYKTKAAQEQQKAAHLAGHVPLLTHEHDQVQAMAAAIREHPIAGPLFNPEHGTPEVSLFWRDSPTGIMRRARFDWLPHQYEGRRLIIPDYKGLALDTPIPTPEGWTTMGALQVGDRVLDSAGQPCNVTHKSEIHSRRCYRMRFDDGSSVVCDDEHLWVTTSGGTQNKPKTGVVDTETIRRTLKLYGQCHHRVQVAEALKLAEVDLPIPPYVLGCWLGDGTAANGSISKPDDELFERIAAFGYAIGDSRASGRCPTRTVYGLRTQLRNAGLLGQKHIPAAYLRASAEQRLDLLRGLMDTDGSWNKTRQQAVFTSTDKALAESVRELACTLGQRAVLLETLKHGFGLTVTAYQVTFTPIRGLNPFALSRKADAVVVRSEVRSRRRLVVAVDEIPTVPTQCIAVDSPDSTYLCTEAFIPTHNTARSADPETFARDAWNHGYFQQAAYYLDGAQALGLAGDDSTFVFVVQEKDPPYVVGIFEPDSTSLQIARFLNRQAIDLYAECMSTGVWPPYSTAVELMAMPAWVERQFMDDIR